MPLQDLLLASKVNIIRGDIAQRLMIPLAVIPCNKFCDFFAQWVGLFPNEASLLQRVSAVEAPPPTEAGPETRHKVLVLFLNSSAFMEASYDISAQSEIPDPQLLRLFVYGTLKQGFWNHDHFFRGVVTVENTMVRGRLFETSSRIPVLLVPEENILAVRTTNPRADVATQARVVARMCNPEPTPTGSRRRAQACSGAPCTGDF